MRALDAGLDHLILPPGLNHEDSLISTRKIQPELATSVASDVMMVPYGPTATPLERVFVSVEAWII